MHKLLYFTKIIIINIFLFYILLFLMEIYFQSKNNNLFKITPYYNFKQISENQELMPMIRPAHLKDIHSNKIVPVSIVSNKKTLLCMNSNDEPIYFQSDKYGFDNIISNKKVDFILIGDSFAAGYCVSEEYRFNNQFKKMGMNIINFGMSGNGPLLIYASVIEFADLYDFKTIVWLFTPENDYADFEREIQNPILKKYLNDDFKQNLISKDKEKEQLYLDYFKSKNRPFKEFLRQYHLDLKLIRKKIKNIRHEHNKDNFFDILSKTSNNPDTINSVNNIIKNLKNYTDRNNKNFLVVYNVLNPEILFNKEESGLKKDIEKNKSFLAKEGINFLDFSDYIYKNYKRSNIDLIMKYRGENFWDHYTEEGYRLLSEQISIKVKNIQNK